MQAEDLKQIKKIIDDSLEEKLEGKLEEKLSKFRDEIITSTKQQFDEYGEQLEEIRVELAKRPTRDEFENWREKKVEPIERDVDKLKYIHKDEWNNLSDSGTVSRELTEAGIKS